MAMDEKRGRPTEANDRTRDSAAGLRTGLVLRLRRAIPPTRPGHHVTFITSLLIPLLVLAAVAPVAVLHFLTPTQAASPPPTPSASLPDVRGHWAEAEVRRAVEAGYVRGYPDGTFRPDRPVTNAELVKMLVAALGVDPRPGTPARFEDVTGHWVQEQGWLGAAEAVGIVMPGLDGPRLYPDVPAERRRAIPAAVRAAGAADDAQRVAAQDLRLQGFQDRPAFHGIEGSVAVAVDRGLIRGYPGGWLRPDRALTRAEAVVLVERVLAAVGGPVGKWPEYASARYGVTFRYPPGWELDPRYEERLTGRDGFVQLGAVAGCGLPVAEVATQEADHKLKPYGQHYRIEAVTVDGREARLVLPGPDQPAEMQGQAALIVPFPEPRRIGENTYCFLVLWADWGHLRLLAQTLAFGSSTAGAPQASSQDLNAAALRGAGRLALVRDGNLYLLDGATGQARLLDGSGQVAGPAFSKDGEWLAYIRREPGLAAGTLQLLRLQGGQPVRVEGLPAPVAPGEYAWSPSEAVLAVAPATAPVGEGLWLVEYGAPARRIAAEGKRVQGFAWSPDGVALAYVVTLPAQSPLKRSDQLRVVDRSSGTSTVRYTADRAGILLAGWWPNSRGLVFWLDPYHSASLAADGLPLVSLSDGDDEARTLATMLPRPDWLAWVPRDATGGARGDRLLLVEGTGRFPWENKRLSICDVEQAVCRPLPEVAGSVALDPAWSPDGKRIAFVQAKEERSAGGGPEFAASWTDGRILVVTTADGRNARPIAEAGQGIERPRWSADGRSVLYVRKNGIWLLDPDGDRGPQRIAALPGRDGATGGPDFAWFPGTH